MSLLGNREQDGYMLGILIATAAGEKLAILSRLRVAPCHKYGYITSPCHYCSTSFLRKPRTARRNHRERVSPISFLDYSLCCNPSLCHDRLDRRATYIRKGEEKAHPNSPEFLDRWAIDISHVVLL